MSTKQRTFLHIAIAVITCELAGVIGSFFTAQSLSVWYKELVKPPLNPPSWVFGPVWTLLFAFMGFAVYLVWRQGWERSDVKAALAIFAVQLALNILWSAVFFGQRSPGGGFLIIVLLWLAIANTIYAFWKIWKPAAIFMVPYLLWVSFAAYLNYAIWQLNK